MTRLVTACALGLWLGGALLLAPLRWFARPGLAERLAPHLPGRRLAPAHAALSAASLGQALRPLATHLGDRVAGLLGARDDLATRLRRAHAPVDVAAFRVRQLGGAVAALATAAGLALVAPLPPWGAAVVVAGAPALAFLVAEHRADAASRAWQRRLDAELPVVSEQLATLLSAGWSLGQATSRLAARGEGACGRDLRRVQSRVHQGLDDLAALREWAALADVPAVHRLVSVLALDHDAGDLGRLVAEEARAMRREAHRRLLAEVERRGQLVWVPVTVATLVPGVLFLVVPFAEAIRLLSG